MYTVVIPTMWVPNPLLMRELFKELNNDILVEKIILIDNDSTVEESIKSSIICDLSKIHHLRMKENIYVNPAWNLGVSHTKTPYVVLLNDDLFTDLGVSSLIQAHNKHQQKDIGLYGMHEECYTNFYGKNSIQEMDDFPKQIKIVQGGFSMGWGCCIILPTKVYPTIPYQLKIWFGDDYLLRHWSLLELPMFNFKNIKAPIWSTTINSKPHRFNSIISLDTYYYEKLKSS